MKQTFMLRFKLDASKSQKKLLLETTRAYTSAMNFVLSKNLNEKSTNVKKLHHEYYNIICQNCGYTEHADIVGAINIATRELSKTQESNLGLLVSQPNAPQGLSLSRVSSRASARSS